MTFSYGVRPDRSMLMDAVIVRRFALYSIQWSQRSIGVLVHLIMSLDLDLIIFGATMFEVWVISLGTLSLVYILRVRGLSEDFGCFKVLLELS